MPSASPTSSPADSPAAPRSWLAAAVLVLAVAAVYWNSLRVPFLFDDTGAILTNPTIRHGFSLEALHPPADGSTTTGRPVVNFSFAISYAISGENVWSYHALNLAIHTLAALALLGIMRRTLTGVALRERFGAAAARLAFVVALLWALHPLQTESVVCIAQRTESLCGLFYLLTLYCFIRGAERGAGQAWGWFGLATTACLLGMGTKEVMVTAPVIVLLYDRTFVAGSFSAAWRQRRGAYAALAATWGFLAWLVLRGGGARGAAAGYGLGISWWSYLLKQCEAIVLYLKLSFWPHPLVLDYGTAVVPSIAGVWWQGAVVVGLLAGTCWALYRRPVLGFAGAWFFVILAPSSSVVPLVTQTMAEHRMYLSLVPVVAFLVLGLFGWIGARAGWILGAAAVALGGATVARIHDYRDTVAIWADNVAKYPQNARAHNNLAWELQKQGRFDEANDHFAQAVALLPSYVAAHYTWGVALLEQKRTTEAIAQFEAAVRLAPGHADAYNNLGNALMQVARAAEAVPAYEAALRLQPGADIHYNLGTALIEVGRRDEAADHLRAALQARPEFPEAHYQLGRAAELDGQPAEAERQYAETVRQAPDHLGAHRKLGLLLARGGQLVAAEEQFRAVVRLQPADADAQANLGNVLLLQGKAREAIACYEEALRLRPNDAQLRDNLQLAREALHP